MKVKIPENIEESFKSLLIKAKSDNNFLFDLLEFYVSLVASGNRKWIELYGAEIDEVLLYWKDKYRTAPALYHVTQGMVCYFNSQLNEAVGHFKHGLEISESTAIFNHIRGLLYMGMATCYRSMGRIDLAMANVYLGIELIQSVNRPTEWQVYTYRIIGEIHVFIGEFEVAEKYYLKAESVMEALEYVTSQTVVFRVYDGLGFCYYQTGDSKKSEHYFKLAEAIPGISFAERARVLCDLGTLYIDEPEKAIPYFIESRKIRKEKNLEDAYSTTLIYYGECLIKSGNLEEAGKILKEAIPIIEKYNVTVKKTQLYAQMAKYYTAMKNFEQSNYYFQLYVDMLKNVNSQQIKNVFKLKNKEIERQNEEIQVKNSDLFNTLNELAKIKVTKKAMAFSIFTVIVLVIATEVFLDPIIEQYSENNYLSLASKILIAFLLKPIDSFYERLIMKKVVAQNKEHL